MIEKSITEEIDTVIGRGVKERILVIDDEEIFRQATACALQRKGFEIHEAADGQEGAEAARRLLPDL